MLGVGFLISKNLAMTTHSVVPDEDIAFRCFVKFLDNRIINHHLDPNKFFFTNRALNFTVVGFKYDEESP